MRTYTLHLMRTRVRDREILIGEYPTWRACVEAGRELLALMTEDDILQATDETGTCRASWCREWSRRGPGPQSLVLRRQSRLRHWIKRCLKETRS